jgi:hypothetical protein
MRARLIGGLPTDLVGSLSGLTQGHFPVHATARYAGAVSGKDARRKVGQGANARRPVESAAAGAGSTSTRRPARPPSPSGRQVVRIGSSKRLGTFVQLRDVYGNTYTYAHLKKTATAYPVPKERSVSKEDIAKELALPARDPKPSAPASAGRQLARAQAARPAAAVTPDAGRPGEGPRPRQGAPVRRARAPDGVQARRRGAGAQRRRRRHDVPQLLHRGLRPRPRRRHDQAAQAGLEGDRGHDPRPDRQDLRGPRAPSALRDPPVRQGRARIDPKPILDGWKLLESTSVYRAKGKNPFFGPDAKTRSVGQILLMGKEALQRRVLRNPRVEIYGCGRPRHQAGSSTAACWPRSSSSPRRACGPR